MATEAVRWEDRKNYQGYAEIPLALPSDFAEARRASFERVSEQGHPAGAGILGVLLASRFVVKRPGRASFAQDSWSNLNQFPDREPRSDGRVYAHL
jgi:hypothetical protein